MTTIDEVKAVLADDRYRNGIPRAYVAFLLAEVERLTSDLTGTDEVVDLLRERAEQAERERDWYANQIVAALRVERDQWKALAEARPEISAEMADHHTRYFSASRSPFLDKCPADIDEKIAEAAWNILRSHAQKGGR